MISARMNALSGATSLGFSTTVQPAARRRRDLGGDLVERVVPRRDAADDADRLAHDERVADLLLELEALDELGVDGEAALRQADLDELRQHLRHADFFADDVRDLVGAGLRPSAMRVRYLARSSTDVCDHAGNAALAALTARSTSFASPAGIVAMTSSVVELMTSSVSLPEGSTQAPSM